MPRGDQPLHEDAHCRDESTSPPDAGLHNRALFRAPHPNLNRDAADGQRALLLSASTGALLSSLSPGTIGRFVALAGVKRRPGRDAPGPGCDATGSARGTVTKTKRSGAYGKIRGTITSYLCQSGRETDQITASYKAKFWPTSDKAIVLRGGRITSTGGLALVGKFKITGGTGRFEDMKGRGALIAQLTCLPSTLTRNRATSCAALGAFSEIVFDMVGSYKDPTVPGS